MVLFIFKTYNFVLNIFFNILYYTSSIAQLKTVGVETMIYMRLWRKYAIVAVQ